MNWARTYTDFLTELGFTVGACSPCNFHHEIKDMAITVHGDDFTVAGSEQDLRWLEAQFKNKFEVKCDVLGPKVGIQKQEIRVLNRILTWTEEGIQYEPDQRHAELVIRDLGLTGCKAVTTPGCRDDANRASDIGDIESDEQAPLLPSREASMYRAVAARLNYLAQDRADLQYACKEASRRMARPREGDLGLLKRIGRYLLGAPRFKQDFLWQREGDLVDVFTDSDWAGCRSTARSTSGGVIKVGWHCLKTWSSTQAVVALSSAEAELYALVKGSSQGLGMISLLNDLGVAVSAKVHTDASAAIGIVSRQGLGKLRHIRVQYLWIQDKVRGGDIEVTKILGTKNPADLMTKHLAALDMLKHMEDMSMTTSVDRASSAPTLNSCNAHNTTAHSSNNNNNNNDNDNNNNNNTSHVDQWERTINMVTRVHRESRKELFTPRRIAGAPACDELTPVRITRGIFIDDMQPFERVDTWTARLTAHRGLGRRWTGTTTFLLRRGCDLQ